MTEALEKNQKQRLLPFVFMGIVLLVIALLVFSDISRSPHIEPENTDPYVLSTSGTTLIIRNKITTLAAGWTGAILIGDRIRTRPASAATIFWPDGSITRLGEKSSIKINEMHSDAINAETKIDFSLEKGRSWSNIIRYLFKDSYFHERYDNDTAVATVRWTVFELDVDRWYIHTIDHAVTLENPKMGSGSFILAAGAIVDSLRFNSLSGSTIDTEWNRLNTDEDIAYINARLAKFNRTVLDRFGKKNYLKTTLESLGLSSPNLFDAIGKNDPETWKKFEKMAKTENSPEIHKNLLSAYETINALPDTPELLENKIRLRDLIIQTAPQSDRKSFIDDFAKLTLYDTWKTEWASAWKVRKKLQQYIDQGADKTFLKQLDSAFKEKNLKDWSDSIQDTKEKTIKDLEEKNYMDSVVRPIPTETIEKVNNAATKIRESLMEDIRKKIWK